MTPDPDIFGNEVESAPKKIEMEFIKEGNMRLFDYNPRGAYDDYSCRKCFAGCFPNSYTYDGTCAKGLFDVGSHGLCKNFFSENLHELAKKVFNKDDLTLEDCNRFNQAFGKILFPNKK